MKNVARILSLVLVAVLLCGVLASCMGGPAKDYKDAKKALKSEDYEVEVEKGDDLDYYGMKGLEAVVEAWDEDWEEYIIIFYFEDAAAAKKAMDKYEDEFDEFVEELEDEDYDVEFKRSGAMIYIGTKQAVKDAK